MLAQEVKVLEGVDKLKDAAGSLPAGTLKWVIIAIVALLVLLILRRMLKGGGRKSAPQAQDLTIDVMALPTEGPPASPGLYYFDIPVRLAAVVLAPVGRVRDLPSFDKLAEVYDSIVPGLSQVVAAHRPLFRRWPSQLSSQGFAHMFFGHAKLPGQGGKGTPWCSVAGVFKIDGQPLMAGLVMRAQTTTNLGQRIIEEEAKWLDILRIKS